MYCYHIFFISYTHTHTMAASAWGRRQRGNFRTDFSSGIALSWCPCSGSSPISLFPVSSFIWIFFLRITINLFSLAIALVDCTGRCVSFYVGHCVWLLLVLTVVYYVRWCYHLHALSGEIEEWERKKTSSSLWMLGAAHLACHPPVTTEHQSVVTEQDHSIRWLSMEKNKIATKVTHASQSWLMWDMAVLYHLRHFTPASLPTA